MPTGQRRAFSHAAQANAARINRVRAGTLDIEIYTVI
jgi:hypothetical protein